MALVVAHPLDSIRLHGLAHPVPARSADAESEPCRHGRCWGADM